MKQSLRRSNHGFTLIEVLVVVGIIALLVAVLVPTLSAARNRARTIVCASNIRNVGTGTYYYAEANKGFFMNAGHWANYAHVYLQRRNSNRSFRSGEERRASINPEIGIYNCPSDRIRHVENYSETKGGVKRTIMYRMSYGLNTFAVQPVDNVAATREGLSYAAKDVWDDNSDDNSGNKNGKKRPARVNMSDIKRPDRLIFFADAGNDNITYYETYWDFDDEEDPTGNPLAVLEVHHRNGNNFSYADLHVEFHKIIKGQWHDGVPRFPWKWIPLDGLKEPKFDF